MSCVRESNPSKNSTYKKTSKHVRDTNEDARAQAHGEGGDGTHDVWIIETLGHPRSLHTLPSFPLTLFFAMAFGATSCVTYPGAVWEEGFCVATKESGAAGRVLGVAEGEWRRGWAGCATLSEGSAFSWYLLCSTLRHAKTMRWGL